MAKIKTPLKKSEVAAISRSRTPLLAGQRSPGISFRLPPKMAKAVQHCQDQGEAGADYPTLSRRFGSQAPTTLFLLGFVELGADLHFRYASGSDEWMNAHRGYRKSADLPGFRQEDDLRAEREHHVLKLCHVPRDYEVVTRLCGDVSALQLLEEEMLTWVPMPGEKKLAWQRGEGRLRTTEKGMEFLASRKH